MVARVLVVDGEAVIRRRMLAALGRPDFETREASDGLSALEALDERARAGAPFHVLVVDGGLSDIDGLKIAALVRSRLPQTKIVVLGLGAVPTAEAVARRGGDALLAKPIDGDRLAALVRQLHAQQDAEPRMSSGPQPPFAGGAWVFVRLDPSLDPLAVLAELGCCALSVHCDAVRDERYGIVQLLRGPAAEVAAQARALLENRTGVVGWELVEVAAPQLGEALGGFLCAYDRAHGGDPEFRRAVERPASYLLVEVHPPERAALYGCLYLLDEVVEIDVDAAGRILLLVQAADFGALRRVIDERVRPLPGVARVHEMKVVPYAKG